MEECISPSRASFIGRSNEKHTPPVRVSTTRIFSPSETSLNLLKAMTCAHTDSVRILNTVRPPSALVLASPTPRNPLGRSNPRSRFPETSTISNWLFFRQSEMMSRLLLSINPWGKAQFFLKLNVPFCSRIRRLETLLIASLLKGSFRRKLQAAESSGSRSFATILSPRSRAEPGRRCS